MFPCQTKMARLNAVCLDNGMPIYVSPESAVEYRDIEIKVEEV